MCTARYPVIEMRADLDQYTLAVLESVHEVAESFLPTSAVSKYRKGGPIVPGWKSEVKPYKDTAFFWHQLWVSCGRPLNTEVHKIMKKTRNIYHYQYKKCKKAEDRIKKDKLLSACLGEGGDLFKEIKAPWKTNSSKATFQNTLEIFIGIYIILLMILIT